MTDRAQSALKATGMDESPLASLEREDGLFVLTAQTLLFQDSGGTRRVTLRDLTRIHSDQEGILRVETPAGTALTASLLGFDAARVQAFFAQVRDTTARAKQQATSSPPAAAEPVSEKAVVSPQAAVTAAPAPVAPANTVAAPEPHRPEAQKTAPTIVIGDPDEDTEPQAQAPAAAPVTRTTISAAPTLTKPAAAPAKPQPQTSQPVVISSSGFSPSSTRPASSNHVTASPVAPVVQPMTAAAPKVAAQTPVAQTPVAPTSVTQPPATQTPSAPTPAATAPASTPSTSASSPKAIRTLPTRSASASGLYAQADAVEALVSRLRILGVVLGVSAIALAFFLFTAGQGLSGIWTLIAGGVGGISLLTLAELARLLVGIARATGNGGNAETSNPESSNTNN
ncbi:hypothetical protein [Deinococcus aquatilis]|jgi:hypothetical protein|uniref:hypothetical protein n=1 Tax=Deinococcus aquatilis TaxID=519440 RepID=UPI000367C7DE|nr:hypothetical protein [Deinococcus aquatilis]